MPSDGPVRDLLADATSAGAELFLGKPFDPEQIRQIVSRPGKRTAG